jgi:hypothetical protein
MGWLRLGALTALTLLGLGGPARGAEVTRIASSETADPFDLHLSIRFDRFQERAQIGRERAGPTGTVIDAEELRYTRKRAALVPRVAIGIYRDMELHFEMPYVLWDDRSWRYGQVGGFSVGPAGTDTTTIGNNDIDADGQTCTTTPCALFPVDPYKATTLYHGGRAGDLTAGLSWGIFNDEKDDTKPFWLVGLDVTFPTASLHEPARNWLDSWINTQTANAAPFGEKIWKWDFYTILSRRMGPADPYVKAHVTSMMTSNDTYSNCMYADELALLDPQQMTSQGAANCEDPSWVKDAGAQLPWVAGITFGTEVVPFQDDAQHQKVTLDLRLQADYTSSQRFYNELTDMSGRLHMTEGYLSMGAFVGLYLRASKNVALHATASLATQSPHYLSGESLGRNGTWPTLGEIAADGSLQNPNFDWRYDAPGRRFRLSEVSLFDIFIAGVLEF